MAEQMAQMVLAALGTIYHGDSSNEQRAHATAYTEQIKANPVEALAVAQLLITPDQINEARHYGMALIQSVIDSQWHRPGFEATQAEIKQLLSLIHI